MSEHVEGQATSRADDRAVIPRHHVSDEALGAYVEGRTDNAAALAIACHLTLCTACQVRMAMSELPQRPVRFVTVERIEMMTFVPSQVSSAHPASAWKRRSDWHRAGGDLPR